MNWKISKMAVSGVLTLLIVALAIGVLQRGSQAQQQQLQTQPRQPLTLEILQQRVIQLEKESAEDYKAIQDLYQRNQTLERKVTQLQTEMNQRVNALSNQLSQMRSQVGSIQSSQAQDNDRTSSRSNSRNNPYFIERATVGRNGTIIYDYE